MEYTVKGCPYEYLWYKTATFPLKSRQNPSTVITHTALLLTSLVSSTHRSLTPVPSQAWSRLGGRLLRRSVLHEHTAGLHTHTFPINNLTRPLTNHDTKQSQKDLYCRKTRGDCRKTRGEDTEGHGCGDVGVTVNFRAKGKAVQLNREGSRAKKGVLRLEVVNYSTSWSLWSGFQKGRARDQEQSGTPYPVVGRS